MADEVNKAAFEGGDTGPKEKAAIKERNEALQKHNDEMAEIGQKLQEAHTEAYDSGIAAEKTVAESTQALVTGAAIGESDKPSAADYGSEGGSKSSKKAS